MQQRVFFRGPMLITLDPPAVEAADILVADGRIARKGWRLHPPRDAELVDARGRILCPGLVNAHVRLDASFLRTLPVPAHEAGGIAKLQAAATEESVIATAFATALDAVRSGTTSLLAFHDAAGFVRGSLARIRDVMSTIGLRTSAACGLSGRTAPELLASALAESKDAAVFGCGGRTAFLVGAGDLEGMSDATLQAMGEAGRRYETPIHAMIGGSADPAAQIARLRAAGLLRPHSILLLLAAIPAAEVARLAAENVTAVRSPSAELAASRAPAPLDGAALGTDAGRADLFEEARLVFARARAAGESVTPEDILAMLGRGQRIASDLFKTRLGSFEPGSAADLLVLDYRASTPLNAATLGHHVLFGMSGASVQSVMVDGHMVVKDRTVMSVDVRNLFRQTQRGAVDLWQRAFGTELPGLKIPMRSATVSDAERREDVREALGGSEDDLEVETLAQPADSLKPWLVCNGGAESEAEAPAAGPPAAPSVPAAGQKAPASGTKGPPPGFGAGIV